MPAAYFFRSAAIPWRIFCSRSKLCKPKMNISARVFAEWLLKKLLEMWKAIDMPICLKRRTKNK
jgi:hypothetical protein